MAKLSCLFGTRAKTLAAAASCFTHLLASLNARLQVVPTSLQLPQYALCGHFALEMFDCSLDALVADLDLERFAQYRFGGIRQGAPSIPHCWAFCKPKIDIDSKRRRIAESFKPHTAYCAGFRSLLSRTREHPAQTKAID